MTDTFTQAVQLVINRETVNSTVSPRTHLADFLREQQMLCGTNIGCEQGVCGACTVMIDGVPARSCITPAIAFSSLCAVRNRMGMCCVFLRPRTICANSMPVMPGICTSRTIAA